jgi:hypothetical protein
MRKLAILIPGSPTAAFFSQIAAIDLALKRLPWTHWRPVIHACFGGEYTTETDAAWLRWRPHLSDVHILHSSASSWNEVENWSQVDLSIASAPRDCDVVMCLDADTLPVQGFEDIVERVARDNLVAGAMAHYPVPPAKDPLADWARWGSLIDRKLQYSYRYALTYPHEDEGRRLTPFYVNGGVMFFGQQAFDLYARAYFRYRERLMSEMELNDFAAQVAFTLAVVQEGLAEWELPLRYNFPNDPIAVELHPREAENVVIYHYLRKTEFDRHLIFTSRAEYERFLALPLEGVNLQFRDAVRRVIGDTYPFD